MRTSLSGKNKLAVIRGGTLKDGVLIVMAHLITNNMSMQFNQECKTPERALNSYYLALTSVNSLHVSFYLVTF